MTKKLAIISTHPIQYYAPVFQLLAKEINIKVFYTAGNSSLEKYDRGFKQKIEWDIPLLAGYDYEFLENVAKDKGSHHFKGIVNPDAVKKINDYKPDAILIYGWANSSHLKIIRYFKNKIPVYFRGDSTLLNQKFNLKNLFRSLFLTWVYKHIDTAFFVGSANKAYFKKYGLKEHQLIFAPHAIDNQRFTTSRAIEADSIRKSLSVKEDDVLILYAGKLEIIKNPELLLDGFIEMMRELGVGSLESGVMVGDNQTKNEKRKTNSDQTRSELISSPLVDLRRTEVHLLFVGNGVLENSLKLKVESLKNQLKILPFKQTTKNEKQATNIHFIGFQNQTQMPAIYQACDLFCLPSTSETWGLAVNEAMACAKAILVSDKVGCAKDLVNIKNGAIFQSGNLADLKQKLIALTNNKSRLKKMGENSLKHIQKWSFKQQVKAIVTYVNR